MPISIHHRKTLPVLVALCWVCFGCDSAPPDLNPAYVFKSNGITFEYPKNWHIPKEPEINTIGDYKVQTVLIHNPQQAPLLLIVQNTQFEESLDELMDLLSQESKEGIADSWMGKTGAVTIGTEFQREPARRIIAGRAVTGLRTLNNIEKLTMGAEAVYEIYTLSSLDSSAWVLVWIASDNIESWQSAEPGYSRIVGSLQVQGWPNGP